jgi:hypothetical protein
MSLSKLNPVEPPWYGPVCPVVWEGWYREVSPYPDQLSLSLENNGMAKKFPPVIGTIVTGGCKRDLGLMS